jgi:hypothetical protein
VDEDYGVTVPDLVKVDLDSVCFRVWHCASPSSRGILKGASSMTAAPASVGLPIFR